MNPLNPPNLGIIIPARIDSSRLERKLLINIHGIPMIEHVRRRALRNNLNLPVVVASGDLEILKVVESFGGNAVHTPGHHENGLSRVGEASKILDWDKYIILQGDEVLARPTDLDIFIQQNYLPETPSVANAVTKLNTFSEIHDESVVKCLVSVDNQIIYIFRKSPLVTHESLQIESIRKICGLFAITHEILQTVLSQPNTRIAQNESIEQLKFIELGIRFGSVYLEKDYPSVNLLRDLKLVNEILDFDSDQKEILQSIL